MLGYSHFSLWNADPKALHALQGLPKPWVFTNGVFDVLHVGHVRCLQAAKALGGSLIVALNSDASAQRLNKGPDRPMNPEQLRAEVIAALACVDAVLLFDENTPYEVIAKIRPDVICKGGDYDMSQLPETGLVQSWGGRAVALPFAAGHSSTALIQRMNTASVSAT
jgi:D-glycero-beta-D-manno-heptose 1-phosphate adenylyltransferase